MTVTAVNKIESVSEATALENCRANLEKAAKQDRALPWRERKLGILEYNRVMRATDPDQWNKKNRRTGLTLGQSISERIIEEGIDQGVFAEGSTVTSVNWDAILAFLKELMPLIIQFITALMAIFA